MIRIYHKTGPLGPAPSLATLMFRPNGTVGGLYTETIDLSTLGKLRVERASHIEFDNEQQAWRVTVEGKVLFCAPTRQKCLEWERCYFEKEEPNEQRKPGV